MTAAYMARCVWLTFYGEYRGGHAHDAPAAGHAAAPAGHGEHAGPHESEPAITIPLIVLSALAVVAGLLSIGGVFRKWTANAVVVHAMAVAHVTEAKFSIPTAAVSVAVALAAMAVAWIFYDQHAFAKLHGLTERSRLARSGYGFLYNKYYLDHLYTDIIVGAIKGPIARGAYWINQNVIDAVVNAAGLGSRKAADFVYNVIDQKLVDGAVNGSGMAAEEGGSQLRRLQTGNVQRYAALFFGLGVVVLGVGIVTLS